MLEKIVEQLRPLKPVHEREVSSDYVEMVLLSQDLSKWETVIEGFVGKVIKPAGKHPDKTQEKLASKYGGIWERQILFAKQTDAGWIVVMFWPWQDSTHVTMKMILDKDHK